MATKHQVAAVPQQQRGGGGVPKGKAKNGELGGCQEVKKNRRALGDIGNLVAVQAAIVEGKPLPQINRPITRSFGAQLLAKAQAAAVAACENKKPVALVGDGAVKKANIREAKPKAAAAVKPRPQEVVIVEDSPNLEEEKKEKTVSRKDAKKKVHTLISVLTARSKAACGIVNNSKPKDYHNIDAADVDDELAVADYVEDLYKFYKLSENSSRPHDYSLYLNSSRPHDYMDSQVEINDKMRAILGDWLIEVHHKFELMPETLFLTFHIIDRYLSMEQVRKRELQLVGVSSMLVASKYEEIWAPQVDDFIAISDHAYSQEQILAMEKSILNRLEWSLTVPTPYMFLVRFIKAAVGDKEIEHMVFFFAELGLIQYATIMYCPSMVAASAVYAARLTLNKSPLWTDTLKHHTGFSEHQLMDCVQILVNCHSAAPESKLKAVYKKYSNMDRGFVALRSPATKVLAELKACTKSF